MFGESKYLKSIDDILKKYDGEIVGDGNNYICVEIKSSIDIENFISEMKERNWFFDKDGYDDKLNIFDFHRRAVINDKNDIINKINEKNISKIKLLILIALNFLILVSMFIHVYALININSIDTNYGQISYLLILSIFLFYMFCKMNFIIFDFCKTIKVTDNSITVRTIFSERDIKFSDIKKIESIKIKEYKYSNLEMIVLYVGNNKISLKHMDKKEARYLLEYIQENMKKIK